MKYTDEQLSRILGECDAGYLEHDGATEWGTDRYTCYFPRGCINQVAFNEYDINVAMNRNYAGAAAFDEGELLPLRNRRTYRAVRNPTALLRALAERGWA